MVFNFQNSYEHFDDIADEIDQDFETTLSSNVIEAINLGQSVTISDQLLTQFSHDNTIISEFTVKSDIIQNLNEPIARYGPFVANTDGEVKQAMLDYQSGKMGKL